MQETFGTQALQILHPIVKAVGGKVALLRFNKVDYLIVYDPASTHFSTGMPISLGEHLTAVGIHDEVLPDNFELYECLPSLLLPINLSEETLGSIMAASTTSRAFKESSLYFVINRNGEIVEVKSPWSDMIVENQRRRYKLQ